MIHIFVNKNSINNNKIKIVANDDNYNHLINVLRIKINEKVLCSIYPYASSFDYLCKIVNIYKESVVLQICEEIENRELSIKINLYQGISKFDKLEFVIEKAVELGVNKIIPLETKYCVAKLNDDKLEKKLDRFNKIAKSAAEQSKRSIVPSVEKPINFNNLLNSIESNNTLLFYENAKGVTYTKECIHKKINVNDIKEINVIIGPEGGFSDEEISKAKEKNINIVSLGNRILRTETAAVTALSILMFEIENK